MKNILYNKTLKYIVVLLLERLNQKIFRVF